MPISSLRVYLVCPEFPPVQTGGGAYVYEYLADEWSEDCCVFVLAGDYTQSTIKKRSTGNLTVIPIPLLRIKGDPPELIARMPPTLLAFVRLLRLVLGTFLARRSSRQIANLHGLGHPVVDIAGFMFWLAKIPYVVTVHGFPGSQSKSLVAVLYRVYERLVTRWILTRAAAVIAISEDLSRTLTRRCVDSDVIPNGIRPNAAASCSRGSSATGRQLLCVGRLAADKGFQYAIQAIEKLTGEHGDVRLLILGEDFGAKAELIGGIPEGIRHRIIFGGHAERETVLREMSRAVAVLIPSLSEPFGLVALEALSVGAVVIASRSGALPEIIEHERSGLLVEPRSARGLAEAVIRVLKDEQLAQLLRVNASARAGDFSTKVAAAKYLDVFERVVPENF